jgi:hypothetical protein
MTGASSAGRRNCEARPIRRDEMELRDKTKIIMPGEDGWIGRPLSTSAEFEKYAQ